MSSNEAQPPAGQSAQGNYIAQASGGSTATVNVSLPRDPVRARHQLPAPPPHKTARSDCGGPGREVADARMPAQGR